MKIFSISKHYVRCEVWTASKTGERFMHSTVRPDKGMTREQRYTAIAHYLRTNHGIKPPKFG